MRRLAALLLFIALPLWAQNPNGLPPCPKPDYSKAQDIGTGGRTWHWNDCWGSYVFTQSDDLRGTILEGEWHYGQLTGQGSYRIPDGEAYDGEFRNFRRHGRGQLHFADGSDYDGEFRDGQRHGQGTYRYVNGDVYVGEFADDERHGQATYHFASGGSYTGEYQHNQVQGFGIYTADNGDIYIGEFADGQRNGHGSYFFASGESYVGGFRNGTFHGEGVFTTAEGERLEARWADGKLVADSARITREQETPPASNDARKRYVSGSGFLITADGYIVTNHHVIEDTVKLTVRTTNGTKYPATVVRIDEANDLAILKINAAGLAFLPIEDSSKVKKGTAVLAAGFPQVVVQGIEPKFTDGIISSLTGIMNDARAFQISNPIQPGNSGGPLFTLDGNVVGIVTAQLSEKTMQKEFDSIPQNVNFAVKSSYLLSLVRDMRALKLARANPKYRFRTTEDVVGAVEPALVLIIGE